MIINPELRRNLWLEFTTQRLIVTPLIIGAILYLCYLTGIVSVLKVAYFIFIFYLFLWGTKLASESIPDEINNRTWDLQRLSVIKPWTLSWGKLLGSPAYAWYGALLALIPYIIISLQTQTPASIALKVFILILGGLFAHSVALLFSMNALQYEKNTKVSTFFYFLIGLLFGWIATHSTLNAFLFNDAYAPFKWYSFNIDFTFYLYSLCIFLVWSVIGIYRSMRSALQYPTLPWVWFVFTVFCMVYFSGFFIWKIEKFDDIMRAIPDALPKYVAFSVAVFITYLALFSEKINVITYKKIIHNVTKPKKAPKWIASFILVIIIGIWISFSPSIKFHELNFIPVVFITSAILFLIRDILIIHYFQFADNPKRAVITSVFYITVLYLLAPGLANALTNYKSVLFFLPGSGKDWIISLLSPAVQAAFMIFMVKQRWRAQSTSTNSISVS